MEVFTVYIIKLYQYFFKEGGTMFPRVGKKCPPPLLYTNVLVRIWLYGIILAFSLFSIHTQELKLFSVELVSGDVKKVNGTVLNKVLALDLRTEPAGPERHK